MFGRRKTKPMTQDEMMDRIASAVAPLLRSHGVDRAWLYGDYYIGIAEWGDIPSIMVDEGVRWPSALIQECHDALGFYVRLTIAHPGTKQTDYALKHSRVIHAL